MAGVGLALLVVAGTLSGIGVRLGTASATWLRPLTLSQTKQETAVFLYRRVVLGPPAVLTYTGTGTGTGTVILLRYRLYVGYYMYVYIYMYCYTFTVTVR